MIGVTFLATPNISINYYFSLLLYILFHVHTAECVPIFFLDANFCMHILVFSVIAIDIHIDLHKLQHTHIKMFLPKFGRNPNRLIEVPVITKSSQDNTFIKDTKFLSSWLRTIN